MSMAIRCDRCGEVFDWSEDNDWNGACFVFNGANHSVKDFSGVYDLCPSCVEELEYWFKGEQRQPREKKKVEISWSQFEEIVSNPTKSEPGLFWLSLAKGSCYTGVDNTTHEAWTEDFATKQECFDWLDGKEKE